MKAWLKGGLIGAGIGFGLLIIIVMIPGLGYIYSIIYFPLLPILFLVDITFKIVPILKKILPSPVPEEGFWFWVIIGIITYILLGILIGWLVGKRKEVAK